MSKISQIKKTVKELLEKFPKYRDHDLSLVSHIWNFEIHNTGIQSAFALLKHHANGGLTSADTITRARRQIQEEFPHLRGKTYDVRQGKRQREVQKDLGYA